MDNNDHDSDYDYNDHDAFNDDHDFDDEDDDDDFDDQEWTVLSHAHLLQRCGDRARWTLDD